VHKLPLLKENVAFRISLQELDMRIGVSNKKEKARILGERDD